MLDYFFKCWSEVFFGDHSQTHIHVSHCAYMQITANFVSFPIRYTCRLLVHVTSTHNLCVGAKLRTY